MTNELDVIGYVIHVVGRAKDTNELFKGRQFETYYGASYTTLGGYCKLFKTIGGAKSAIKYLEKTLKRDNGWEYIVGDVIPLTKALMIDLEKKTEQNYMQVLTIYKENTSKKDMQFFAEVL